MRSRFRALRGVRGSRLILQKKGEGSLDTDVSISPPSFAMEESAAGPSSDSQTKKGAVYKPRYVQPAVAQCRGCRSPEGRSGGRNTAVGEEKERWSETQRTHSFCYVTQRDPITNCMSTGLGEQVFLCIHTSRSVGLDPAEVWNCVPRPDPSLPVKSGRDHVMVT